MDTLDNEHSRPSVMERVLKIRKYLQSQEVPDDQRRQLVSRIPCEAEDRANNMEHKAAWSSWRDWSQWDQWDSWHRFR